GQESRYPRPRRPQGRHDDDGWHVGVAVGRYGPLPARRSPARSEGGGQPLPGQGLRVPLRERPHRPRAQGGVGPGSGRWPRPGGRARGGRVPCCRRRPHHPAHRPLARAAERNERDGRPVTCPAHTRPRRRRYAWIGAAIAVALTLPSAGVRAQTTGEFETGASNLPIDSEAENGIEWRRDEKVYVARGNASATRGDFSVKADTLTAYYRDTATGGTQIFRVQADGHVRLASTNQTIYGDHGVYDLDSGVLRVTGNALRAETPDQTITARDSFEYWRERDVVVARGNALAVKADQQVKADLLSGYYRKDETGVRHLYQIEATGNVQIRTPKEYALCQKAVYNLDSRIATLTGGVKITRERVQLNGEYAEMNMKTNISRILAGKSGD